MARLLLLFLGLLGLTAALFWVSRLPPQQLAGSPSNTQPLSGDPSAKPEPATPTAEGEKPIESSETTLPAAAPGAEAPGEIKEEAKSPDAAPAGILPMFDAVSVDAKGVATISGVNPG
jgi:cytoskeletal protein RodZ